MPRPPADAPRSGERGFTLIEIMTAIAILVFGVVSLVGLLGVGVATHRSAEQHDRAVRLAERVLQRIEEEIVPRAIEAAAAANATLTLPAVDSTTADIEGFPGLRYRIEFTLDPDAPTTALCKLRVLWLDQGEAQAVEFHRILVSHVPFPQRIARLREGELNVMKHISATASFVLCLAAAAPAQVVQLADGHILAGEIQQVTGEGFVLTRADNGGQLQLRWEHLAAESASEVKKLFDISVEDEGEVLVEAQVIKHMTQSGILREDIGRPISVDGTVINLRARGNTIVIPRRALRSIGTRRVPVAQVYTREEFYQEKLAEFAPGDDADRHILLADFLVRVADYEHSEAHLKRAAELGNSKQPGALRAKIAKVDLYKSVAGERGLLDQIKALRARKDFSRGGELLAEFETKYATGKLGAEFAAEKQRFAEARERFYVQRVAEGWSLLMTTIAKSKILEAGLTLSAARSYGESEMGRDIAKRLAERLKLGVDEVTTLWSQRITAKAVTGTQLFAYGVGSWTLGDQKIMANTQQDKEDKAGAAGNVANEQQQAAERQQRKIREFLERAKQAQQAAGGNANKTETDEDWWRAAPPDERANFLKAYYAENSGDLEIVTAHLTACVTCTGLGYLEVIGNSGKEDKLKCLTCKGTKFKRWFRAR